MDVLPKLALLSDASVPERIPIVVTSDLASTGFFRQAVLRGELATRTFLPLSQSEVLEADELFVAQGAKMDVRIARAIRRYLGVEPPRREPSRRIFLNRSAKSGRCLSNFRDLEPILSAFGFEIVELEDMSLDEQIQLFQETRHLVAIHGAGMANMIFSYDQPLSILELVPRAAEESFDGFRPLASTLGFGFSRLLGVDEPYAHKRAAFAVEPSSLASAISALLADPATQQRQHQSSLSTPR